MAKVVQVQLKDGDEWTEFEVANFYDPEIHHTVRVDAKTKVPYAKMKMPTGKIYDKLQGKWYTDIVQIEPPTEEITLTGDIDLNGPLPYGDNTAKKITADMVLQYVENITGLMDECYRILGPMGVLEVVVPLYPNESAFDDPNTKTIFTQKTFHYFKQFRTVIQRVETPYLRVSLRK